MKQNIDVYAIVTDRILKQLEQGKIPWQKPWNCSESMPRNIISKRPYRGINSLILATTDYNSPYWLTYKQALDLEGYVRSGEKAIPIVYWNWQEKKTTKTNENGEEEQAIEKIAFLRYFSVFNLEQCEIPAEKIPAMPERREINSIEAAEIIAREMPDSPEIKFKNQDRACYFPELDIVQIPEINSFMNSESYYDTLFHELVHSTGHERRLNRTGMGKGNFGSSEYSKEELVGELGAAFLCGEAGITERVISNETAYIQSWLSRLQDDRKLLVHAAAQAQKAADFILNRKYENGNGENYGERKLNRGTGF